MVDLAASLPSLKELARKRRAEIEPTLEEEEEEQ